METRELRIENVPTEIVDKVKIKAIKEGITLREAVIEALKNYTKNAD